MKLNIPVLYKHNTTRPYGEVEVWLRAYSASMLNGGSGQMAENSFTSRIIPIFLVTSGKASNIGWGTIILI
jgi:hypothetical protein